MLKQTIHKSLHTDTDTDTGPQTSDYTNKQLIKPHLQVIKLASSISLLIYLSLLSKHSYMHSKVAHT